jgi:hypothetical protein
MHRHWMPTLNRVSLRPPALQLLPPVPLLPPCPELMDPSNSSAAAGSSSGAKRRGHPPSSGNKAKIPAQWMPGAGGPLCIGALRQDKASRAASGASGALTIRGHVPGGALNSPSPLAAAPAPRALVSVDRELWEAEAAPGPPPPAADPSAPPANGVVATPRHLAAAMLGPLDTSQMYL